MLLPINRLINAPIMSLQMEAEIARTDEPIVDPRKLIIVGFYVDDRRRHERKTILHSADIREVSHLGLIVDDGDAIMPLDDLVRIQEIIGFNFKLLGLPVVDENGKKYGRVNDYSVDPKSFYIQQLYTHQSLLQSFSSMSNVINRSQVISVTNKQIVIAAPTVKDEVEERAAVPFVNPFRAPDGQGNQSSIDNARRTSS